MRILHVVKTSDGAQWAAEQVSELVSRGVEVHVLLPRPAGAAVESWKRSGATIHILDVAVVLRHPWRWHEIRTMLLRLIERIGPDLIHSHFVQTTLVLRLMLGRKSGIPRLYQVAGPLHLEHLASRHGDIATAGPDDWWVGSSRCIVEHYRAAGIAAERIFLSYYGTRLRHFSRNGFLRTKCRIPNELKIVGNINLIYPPKYWLGQAVGLKCHEDVIDALGMVLAKRNDVVGVLIGATFGGRSPGYERRLRRRAEQVGRGRILMPGFFTVEEVQQSWPDFDCAVHVPLSENCGGVVEPLLAGVPTVAARVGGLAEVVIDGLTGTTVPVRNPEALAAATLRVLADANAGSLAATGRRLVEQMFDVRRTAAEIGGIYQHILCGASRPVEFAPTRTLQPEAFATA